MGWGWETVPVLRLRHNQCHQSDENRWVMARFLNNHPESNQALHRSAQKKKKKKILNKINQLLKFL